MRRALLLIILITIGGGGFLKHNNLGTSATSSSYLPTSTSATTDVIFTESTELTQQHYPDQLPTSITSKPPPHHHHHHHKHHSKPPSPFTARGLAVINRCTLAVQNKNRAKLPKWSDEYLIRPLTIPQLKPSILESPHKIGGLYCRAGIWFEMLNKSPQPSEDESWLDPYQIRGTRNLQSQYALLEFYSIAVGLVSIRGLETKDFLCMDRRGELYVAPLENYTTECIFKEDVLENYYNSYSSCAYGNSEKQWYLALRHSGIPRRGRHVASYDIGAQFLVKELDKSFWVKSKIPEPPPKSTNGFDDDGFNWLEKMTNSWQDFTSQKKESPPSLIGIRNIDNDLLEKLYDSISRRFTTRQSHAKTDQQQANKTEKTQALHEKTDDKLSLLSNELRSRTAEELTSIMERKKRRMDREERRRRHRRKELEHLRKYPTHAAHHKLRSLTRYNHSKALTDRLKHLSDEISPASTISPS